MYTTEEFAKINKGSTRMLRHYDKIGLLIPSEKKRTDNRYTMKMHFRLSTG